MNSRRILALASASIALTLSAAWLSAGPLNPPAGPVAPSYRTLSEIEPRTPVQSLSGNATALYTITEPGSYYLTGHISVPIGKHGIIIMSDRVTLDLGGFCLQGVAGSLTGVWGQGAKITVRNGTVRGFGGPGIDLLNGNAHTVDGVHVNDCGSFGVQVGLRSHVTQCSANDNAGAGFRDSGESTFDRCEAHHNARGFEVYRGTMLRGCLAGTNTGHGFHEWSVGVGVTLIDCVATANLGRGFDLQHYAHLVNCRAAGNYLEGFCVQQRATIINCAAGSGGNHGYFLGFSSTILDSTATGNLWNGIVAASGCTIRGCTVTHHTLTTSSVGIQLTGLRSLIDSCNVTNSYVGIKIDLAQNRVTRTTCAASTVSNWEVVAGNQCYVVVAPNSGAIGGNSGGVPSGITDPNANFSY